MKKKIWVWMFLSLTLLSACGKAYSATIYELKNEAFTADFLKDHKVQDAYYDDLHPAENNESLPKERVFVINNEAEYRSIFASSEALTVDFDVETVILYTYTAINIRKVSINSVTQNNHSLTVELKEARPPMGVGDTTIPQQRFIVIKTNKVDISDAKVLWVS